MVFGKIIRKDGWLNNQLIWCVVRYGLLAVHQCGHRNQLQLLIIYLKCAIQSCFVERKHMVTIFFYFKKQLDTPCFWYNLEAQHLKTAHFMAILRKPAEIHWKFFSEHALCQHWGKHLTWCALENGVPQDCPLSRTLFAIINIHLQGHGYNDWKMPVQWQPHFILIIIINDDYWIQAGESHKLDDRQHLKCGIFSIAMTTLFISVENE